MGFPSCYDARVQSDGELLAAWQAGDREAGGALIDRYFEPVRRFFENKVADGIEDLIQQTFLALVGRRDHIRDPEAFRGYLFRGGAQQALQLHRRAHALTVARR